MLTVRALFIRKGTWLSGVIATAPAGSTWAVFRAKFIMGYDQCGDEGRRKQNFGESLFFCALSLRAGIILTGRKRD